MADQILRRARRLGAGCLAALLALPCQALASEDTLDEIVVTSQKREQSALEVPVTVDVFTASDIEKTGSLDLGEMQDYVPGFEVGISNTQASLTIRGISSANISTGGDPSVATFYDDAYIPRAATQIAFSDMARIEVLKGPQGTLYGRNAAVGVVNMVPNQPGPEDEGFVKVRAGNYDLLRLEAMGNFALSDNFFVRANLLSNQRDGYLTNIAGSPNPGKQDNLAARIAALWQVTEATGVQLSYDYDKVDNAARGAIGLSPWGACPDNPTCGQVSNDVIDGYETRDMYAVTGKLFHDWSDDFSMKFVASYRDYDTANRQDEDGTAQFDRYLDTDNVENSDITYTELQFNWSNDRVSVVFGGNYSVENTHQDIPVNTNVDSAMRAVSAGIAAETGLPISTIWDPNDMAFLMSALLQQPITPAMITATGDFFYNELDLALPGTPIVGPSYAGNSWSEYYFNDGDFTNWGVYADVDYHINDSWEVLFGLRYSSDDKTFSWQNPPNSFNQVRPGTGDIVFVVVPGYTEARTGTLVASDSWSKVTGRAVVNYKFSDTAHSYLSYSTGYRSGGFDSLDVTTSDNPLRPEESENLELGLKGDFFESRLQAQVSLFDMQIDGRQRTVDTLPPGQPSAIPRVISGDQDVVGVELTLKWIVVDNVNVGFLTTWRDQEAAWETYYNAVGDLVTETTSGTTDTDYTLLVDWYPAIDRGSLDVRLEYIFNENNEELDPGIVDPNLPGFGEDRNMLNARVAWTSEDDRWTTALWGKNLLDEKQLTGISDITTASFGTPFASMYAPLTWGIEVDYNFY